MFAALLAAAGIENQHYWQVYFDTNRVIREAFTEAGYPAPEQRVAMRNA